MILGTTIENLLGTVDIEPVMENGELVRAKVKLLKNGKFSPDVWEYLPDFEQRYILNLIEGTTAQIFPFPKNQRSQ